MTKNLAGKLGIPREGDRADVAAREARIVRQRIRSRAPFPPHPVRLPSARTAEIIAAVAYRAFV